MPNRRAVLFAAATFAATAAMAAPAPLPDDMSMGSPKAKIQVVEYASVGCPHCAHFNEAVFAPFKAKWVDTGKARYTLKEMLNGSPTLAMAGFLVARCAGPGKYFKVVDAVFRSEPQWAEGKMKPILQRIASENGLDESHFNACLSDEAAIGAVNARARRATEQDGVEATPTLFINGKKIENTPRTADEMDAAIADVLKGGH